jgi:protein phosphatase
VARVWFDVALRSAPAPRRSTNQDAAAGWPDAVVVADGVGGHAGGEVASATVTGHLVAALAGRDAATLSADGLRALVAEADAALRRRAEADADVEGMATTLTALVAGDGVVRVVHVGDSRAYRLAGGATELVTHDDSLVQRLVDAGAIAEGDAFGHPRRNVILRSLHGDPDDAADAALLELPAAPGERWLLCSDGLSDVLGDRLEVPAGGDVSEAADALLAAAVEASARDDVTVAVCDVLDAPPADVRLRTAGALRDA